jgi:hypothetical protein
MKIHPQIGPYCHALCAQELERRGLSVGSSVNSALWLENLDSLSTRFHQILISRLICKRAIAVQNLGVPQRRLGALGHSATVLVSLFLKPGDGGKS